MTLTLSSGLNRSRSSRYTSTFVSSTGLESCEMLYYQATFKALERPKQKNIRRAENALLSILNTLQFFDSPESHDWKGWEWLTVCFGWAIFQLQWKEVSKVIKALQSWTCSNSIQGARPQPIFPRMEGPVLEEPRKWITISRTEPLEKAPRSFLNCISNRWKCEIHDCQISPNGVLNILRIAIKIKEGNSTGKKDYSPF